MHRFRTTMPPFSEVLKRITAAIRICTSPTGSRPGMNDSRVSSQKRWQAAVQPISQILRQRRRNCLGRNSENFRPLKESCLPAWCFDLYTHHTPCCPTLPFVSLRCFLHFVWTFAHLQALLVSPLAALVFL
mmetsp:Transcript_19250/g.60548  ORF Transcript_19250/g.60548 Transcript_19250/m.60548 type:complete len:131 (-) Transcript_19250:290-682(-)